MSTRRRAARDAFVGAVQRASVVRMLDRCLNNAPSSDEDARIHAALERARALIAADVPQWALDVARGWKRNGDQNES